MKKRRLRPLNPPPPEKRGRPPVEDPVIQFSVYPKKSRILALGKLTIRQQCHELIEKLYNDIR